MTTAAIETFRGDYRWLSNFVPVRIVYEGRLYPTVEHAYQAAKTSKSEEKQWILACVTAGQAKRAGRRVTMRPDWESAKREVMLDLLRLKFKKKPYRQWLRETGDAILVEGNDWGDTYWGVCRGKGQNVLGVLIMQVRAEISGRG